MSKSKLDLPDNPRDDDIPNRGSIKLDVIIGYGVQTNGIGGISLPVAENDAVGTGG